MSRGALSEAIRTVCNKHNIQEINLTQLRLLPYIQYCLVNQQGIDPRRINTEERGYLKEWKAEGYLEGGSQGLRISKKFWNFINDCLWVSYVTEEGRIEE